MSLFRKRVLYFVPHQDDELLTMGADICQSLEKKWDVHVILCTDGSGSNVRLALGDGKSCGFHDGVHNFALTKEAFVKTRDQEFTDSCLALGIKRRNIHIPENRAADGSITPQQAEEMMRHYLKRLGKRSLLCTFSCNNGSEQHKDHKVLGMAADNLLRSGVIRKYRAFIERSLFEKVNDSVRMVPVSPCIVSAAAGHREKVENAVAAYSLWNPEKNRYAVGYHSVMTEFDDFMKDIKSCWFMKQDEEHMRFWERMVWNHRKWQKLRRQKQMYYTAEPCEKPNMMGLTLKHFEPEQLDSYRAFCEEYNMELRDKDIQRLQDGSSFWCVIMKNGRIASTGWLTWNNHFYIGETDYDFDMDQSSTAILFDFNTRPEYRGRGYYGILLRSIMANAVGPERYMIYTSPSNHASDRGILKAGFHFDGALCAEDGSLDGYLAEHGFTSIVRKSAQWESPFLSWLENKLSIAQPDSGVK